MPTAPATETIYVRVPETTKRAARDYSEAKGTTLTSAIGDLLERGLEAVENDESIRRLQLLLQAKDIELQQAESRIQGLRALSTTPLGACGTCQSVVTAEDVLVRGKCPRGHTMRPPGAADKQSPNGLDDKQALVLIGAVGLLLGALALSGN
jgi:hypothetical protein